SFFLPVNVEIGQSTDLLSRGISVNVVSQIASRARAAGVFVLMTTPAFPAPVEGTDARPAFNGDLSKPVVTVFSSSNKVPISQIDAASVQGAETRWQAIEAREPRLADLVKAFSGEGTVCGTTPEASLVGRAEASPAGGAATASATDDVAAEKAAQEKADAAREA